MTDPLKQLETLHGLLTHSLRSSSDLHQAASICRSLVASDIDGAGAFLLFAFYFESLEKARYGNAGDVERYEDGISVLLPLIEEALQAIESYDTPALHAALDSFARTAQRLLLP
jgi:hypothetical protein